MDDKIVEAETRLFAVAEHLIRSMKAVGRTREEAWDLMVGPDNEGAVPDVIFNMLWSHVGWKED